MHHRPLTRIIKPQRGAAVVELAIILVLMLMIVAGIIAFGRIYWYADSLTKVTRDAARIMSMSPVSELSANASIAQNMVINAAAAANLPSLDNTNVSVQCDNSPEANPTYTFGACINNTKPANVRVSITNYAIDLTEWFPFIAPSGIRPAGTMSWSAVNLAPHTTMRYMN